MKLAIVYDSKPIVYDTPDIASMLCIDAHGTTGASATAISLTPSRTIAICRHVDASNVGIALSVGGGASQSLISANSISGEPIVLGAIVEIYAEGGPITVYPDQFGGAFLDGTTSITVSTGRRFMLVLSAVSGVGKWAFLD